MIPIFRTTSWTFAPASDAYPTRLGLSEAEDLLRQVVQWRNEAKALVSHVVEEKVPAIIHETLNNGIRSVMSDVVRDEIRRHEEEEEARFRRVLEGAQRSKRRR